MAIFDTLFAENGIRNNIPTSKQQTGVLSVETGWTQEYAKNPLMGGRFVKLGDMNAIIHDTQKGVNDLEIQLNRRIDNLPGGGGSGGVRIVSNNNENVGVLNIGTQILNLSNNNTYIILDNSGFNENSIFQNYLDIPNSLINTTPLGISQTITNIKSSYINNTILTNTTGRSIAYFGQIQASQQTAQAPSIKVNGNEIMGASSSGFDMFFCVIPPGGTFQIGTAAYIHSLYEMK